MVWRRMFGRQESASAELTPVQARQGYLDRPVLFVLVASTVLVCAIFAFMLLRF